MHSNSKKRNLKIFIVTMWIYTTFSVLQQYITIYAKEIGISYIDIGIALSWMTFIGVPGAFFSGYIADNYNKRYLSASTLILYSIGNIILALSANFLLLLIASTIVGSASIVQSGGTSYFLSQMDKETSGSSAALAQMGNIFCIATLFILSFLLINNTFVESVRFLFIVSSIAYFISGIARLKLMSGGEPEIRERLNIIKDFVNENKRFFKVLVSGFPVFIAIIVLDATSNAIFRYVILFYMNENLAMDISNINVLYIFTYMVVIVVSLFIGPKLDRLKSWRNPSIVIYSIVPISILLLIFSSNIYYWMTPPDFLSTISIIFTIPFIALILKNAHDFIWMMMITIYMQKMIEPQEYGKAMSLQVLLVYAISSVCYAISGVMYTLFGGITLFMLIIFINIMLLIVLSKRSLIIVNKKMQEIYI